MDDFYIKRLITGFIICDMCITTALDATNITKIEANYNTKGITINNGIVNFSPSQVFEVEYNTATSGREFGSFIVTLEIIKVGDFWRISEVNGDETSSVYTGCFVNEIYKSF